MNRTRMRSEALEPQCFFFMYIRESEKVVIDV